MKAILINGSARKNGNTRAALETVADELKRQGIGAEYVEIGNAAIHGCTGCGWCGKNRLRRCVFDDDCLNANLETLFAADGLVVGSPVYYAGVNGALKSFLDRAFFVGAANGFLFRHKVGAAVVAARRGGEIAAWEQLNKYFSISEMFIPSSAYWNMAFGMAPGEAKQDLEGMDTMRILGRNMAWLMRSVAEGGESLPPVHEKARTNFIR